MSGAGLRRFLIVDQSIIGAVINFVLNAAIAWAVFHSMQEVPLSGQPSMAGDTIATSFLLPLIICLIVTPLVRHQVSTGKLAALKWDRMGHSFYRRMPKGAFFRGTLLGLVCTLVFAPIMIWSLKGLGITAMASGTFIVVKGLYAAVLAAIVTPVIAYAALGDATAPVQATD